MAYRGSPRRRIARPNRSAVLAVSALLLSIPVPRLPARPRHANSAVRGPSAEGQRTAELLQRFQKRHWTYF